MFDLVKKKTSTKVGVFLCPTEFQYLLNETLVANANKLFEGDVPQVPDVPEVPLDVPEVPLVPNFE